MRCEEVIDKLDSYLGCELSEIEEFNIKKHISKCTKCKEEYDALEEVFITLSTHDMIVTPIDFTENIISEINVYERNKTTKETLIYKGLASVLAAGMISTLFNFIHYRPINLFSQIYRSSEKINRVIVEPTHRLTREIKDMADSF